MSEKFNLNKVTRGFPRYYPVVLVGLLGATLLLAVWQPNDKNSSDAVSKSNDETVLDKNSQKRPLPTDSLAPVDNAPHKMSVPVTGIPKTGLVEAVSPEDLVDKTIALLPIVPHDAVQQHVVELANNVIRMLNELGTNKPMDLIPPTENGASTAVSTETTEITEGASQSDVDRQLDAESIKEYVVATGDTIAKILQAEGVGYSEVIALTKKFPNLGKELLPDQILTWTLDENGKLQHLRWILNRKETRNYHKVNNVFSEEVEITAGEWKEYLYQGEIGTNGKITFIGSAIEAGLNSKEAYNLARFLAGRVSLNALQVGDKFSVLLEREHIHDEYITSRVLSAKISYRKKDHYIVYFEKYRSYFGEDARQLTEGFLRYPTRGNKRYKISSHFNPRRLHPITKKVKPHNGVDFATPIGTPIISVGDGEIMIARYSPSAGNYVAIQHGKTYSTRYMHMSRIAVRAGQIVKKGDVIGYSGNTGYSSGPHLHYEFLINNKPVDPMKVKLPRQEELKKEDMADFKKLFAVAKKRLDGVAKPTTQTEASIDATAVTNKSPTKAASSEKATTAGAKP